MKARKQSFFLKTELKRSAVPAACKALPLESEKLAAPADLHALVTPFPLSCIFA